MPQREFEEGNFELQRNANCISRTCWCASHCDGELELELEGNAKCVGGGALTMKNSASC